MWLSFFATVRYTDQVCNNIPENNLEGERFISPPGLMLPTPALKLVSI